MREPRTLRLDLAYDGTGFVGWQVQASGRTVQGELQRALRRLLQDDVTPVGSGRTDAGTHALGQVAHIHTDNGLAAEQILRGVNALLPADVAVSAVRDVDSNFHARFSARGKRYRYRIDNRFDPDVFGLRYAHHMRAPLDEQRMAKAARCLMGTHDFACFEAKSPQRKSTVRTITAIEVHRRGLEVTIEVEGNGFLYNMVRIIAGTLIVIGRGKWPIPRMAQILKSRDRKLAGPTPPACGLYLLRVTY